MARKHCFAGPAFVLASPLIRQLRFLSSSDNCKEDTVSRITRGNCFAICSSVCLATSGSDVRDSLP